MDFESQLAELFAQRLSLADEAIVSYVAGVARDDQQDREARAVDIGEFLQEALSTSVDHDVIQRILDLAAEHSTAAGGKEGQQGQASISLVKLAQMHSQALQEADEELRQRQARISEEERQRRQQLIAEYGIEAVEQDEAGSEDDEAAGAEDNTDGEQRPLSERKQRRQRKEAAAADLASAFANSNRVSVDEERRKRQEQARTEAKMKAAKDKADLQKDKASKDQKKEERRQKAVKGERRR